ncbi:hypothetical protein [Devosia sp. CAU 1758]
MKMLVIAADGDGAFRCALVRNPDLYRRQIARETGAAFIVWAGLSILACDAEHMLAQLACKVLPCFTARPQLQHDPVFVAALGWALWGRPLVIAVWRNAIRRLQKSIQRLSPSRYLRQFRQAGD